MINVKWNDIQMRIRALKRLKQIPESLRTVLEDATVPRKEMDGNRYRKGGVVLNLWSECE